MREATALDAFLQADPQQWTQLAPLVVERVGVDRLRSIVEETRDRVGGFRRVVDSPQGLLILGTRGHVLAWARTDSGGELNNLLISPAGKRRWNAPPHVYRWGARLAWCLLLSSLVNNCWTAPDVTGWLGSFFIVATAYLVYEGYFNSALEPWWVRRPIETGALVALGSVIRLPHLAVGGDMVGLVEGVLLVTVGLTALVRSRLHRWHVTTAEPLARFPLSGTWYIGQGGGYGLNHHLPVSEQRGALDLLQVGPGGSRSGDPRSLDSYLAYGAQVYAPCAGRVVAAVDGIEDQVPGNIRFGPVYGNHVFVDTGAETVKLAHLRPGTVAVTAGQDISVGQVLGEVGNSGHSSEPHLHIHVEREGQGLDLRFAGITGALCRGRKIRA